MEPPINTHNEEQGIFDSFVIHQYTEASKGSRFLNFLIDNLFMRFALSYVTGYIIGYLLSVIAPEFLARIAAEDETSLPWILLGLIIGYFNYITYYTFCEFAFKGYTLGKLITGTKAIRDDGKVLTLRDAFLRSLSRIVPFEPFSALGDKLWHDSWTNTMVVKAR